MLLKTQCLAQAVTCIELSKSTQALRLQCNAMQCNAVAINITTARGIAQHNHSVATVDFGCPRLA
jgi:hypothetical protein